MANQNERQVAYEVDLKVNDRDIALNHFAAAMLAETVLGMLRPLRGTGEAERVQLEIRRPAAS